MYVFDLVVTHDHNAHRKNDDQLNKQREKKKIELFIVLFSNASSKPRTMMVHFFNANAAYVAM
jgi:hypothetical protein